MFFAGTKGEALDGPEAITGKQFRSYPAVILCYLP
jgi:hypothetical protein